MEKRAILFWFFAAVIVVSSFAYAATVSHRASEVTSGQFAAGNFTFLNNVIVNSKVGIGTSNPGQQFVVVGSTNITGDTRIGGSLFGNGPVKVAGGLNVTGGSLNVSTICMGSQCANSWASAGSVLSAYKTSSESVTSSTTLQNDDHLFFPMEANGVYSFEIWLSYTHQSAPDIKVALNGPSGVNWVEATVDQARDGASNTYVHRVSAYESAVGEDFASTTEGWILIKGTVSNGANAGDLVLRWAQLVSSGTAATVRRGSYLTAYKMN